MSGPDHQGGPIRPPDRPAAARARRRGAHVQRAAYVTEAQRYIAPTIPPLVETLDELRADLAAGVLARGAWLGPRLVGSVRGRVEGSRMEVLRFSVAPDVQGLGVGRALLTAVHAAAPPTVQTFWLVTGAKSPENLHLYTSSGYRVVGTVTDARASAWCAWSATGRRELSGPGPRLGPDERASERVNDTAPAPCARACECAFGTVPGAADRAQRGSAMSTPTRSPVKASPTLAPSTGRRLLLLDGHSLAYRAFFALPAENFRTGTGQTTNAVYGFTSMLINLLRDEQPSHLAVCFDVSRSTFRSERYTEYKANRTTTPDDFRGQVDLIKEVLKALAIPEFGVPGYEADDLIATLATKAEVDGFEVLITTGDRDAFQLVSENVMVLYPTRGVSELGRIDPDAVMARYGLTPAQYPDFAALRGDPSDNLPSIPGVGEKTAAKWVREFGSLAELTDRVDEVKGKAGDALRANLANVLLNRQLTELVRDVPLEVAPARARGAPVGPRGRAPAVRRAGVPGPARAPVRHARERRARGRGRASRCRAGRSLPALCGPGSTRTPATGAGSGSRSPARSPPGPAATSTASPSPRASPRSRLGPAAPPPASPRPPTSTFPGSPPTTRARWGSGWPIRRCPRPPTTPSRRCTRCAAAAGASPG